MRILSVTPIRVSEEELARRQERYRSLLPEGLELTLLNVDDRAPAALDDTEDLEASDAAIERVIEAHADGYDVVLPDCVLDPMVLQRRDASPRTVGILELTLNRLAARGDRCAAVTRNTTIGDALAAQVERYGHSDVLTEVRILNLDVESISDEQAWADALTRVGHELAAEGFTAVFNGCSAVETRDMDAGLEIIDPLVWAFEELANE